MAIERPARRAPARPALVLVVLTALLLAAAPPRAAAPAHWSDATRRVVLDNGLTVLMLQRGALPVVSVEALYRFGSRNEHPNVTGGAHFLEHMAFRSTDEIAKQDLTNQILRWGGRWNGYTSYDQTVYASAVPNEHLEWVIYLESQRMRHVQFSEAAVDRERTSVIAEEQQYRNSPGYVLDEHRLRRAALVAHPYGSPIMGRMSDLLGITAPELERLYREHYAPNNAILAIVGRFDETAALALVRKYFGGMPGDGRSTALRTVEPEQHGPRRVTLHGTGSVAHLEMLVHSPAARDEAFATLLALDGVLAGGKAPGSGGAARGSRLYRALVASGLATSVRTNVELSQYPAVYGIGVDAPPDADLHAVEARLDEALADAARTVSAAEVARAVQQVQVALAFDADSNRSVADLLAVYEEMQSYRLLAELPARLDAVTPDEVRAFAHDRLDADHRTIGWLVPDRAAEAGSGAAAAPAPPPAPDSAPKRNSARPLPPPSLEVPDLPAPATRRLDNGVTLLALHVPGEAVSVRVRVEAGAADDPPGLEGAALLAARLLTDSQSGPASALDDPRVSLDQSAFDRGPFANRDYVEITATCFPASLDAVGEALAAAVTAPAFDGPALDRARRSLAASTAARADDSRWRADRAVFEHLYASEQRYGRPREGTPESLARITRDDLLAFHRAFYRPERTVVAVAGPVDAGAAIESLARAFGAWRAQGSPPAAAAAGPGAAPAPPAGAAGTPRLVVVPLQKAQASISVGLPGIAHDSSDDAALATLNYLLGETGYAGRLGETLVDTGLSYAVYAHVFADRGAGPIFITTDAVHAAETVDRIVKTLQGFASGGVTNAELADAKGYVLGRLLFRFESATAATSALADLGYFGPPDALRTFARRVLALTRDDLAKAASRYYDPARAVVAVAGRWDGTSRIGS